MSSSGERSSRITNTHAYRAILGCWTHPVILACSGGFDSTALVLVASEAAKRQRVGPFTVCHVDHRSRPDSRDDAEYVANLCDAFDIPFEPAVVDSGTVPAGESREAFWREQRYRALFDAAIRAESDTIVTAHTLDDQVETILMRAFSGAGWQGMGDVVAFDHDGTTFNVKRPLLRVSRSELAEVVSIAGVVPLEDPSNHDISLRRNAVRRSIVPTVREVFPGFERALARSADLVSADGEYCDLQAEALFSNIAQVDAAGSEIAISASGLVNAHPALATRVVLDTARRLLGDADGRELTQERVASVLTAARRMSAGKVIELPYGIRVVSRTDGELLFKKVEEGAL